ncbi:SDR family NAD(P)-dependent oxidoreductase [Rhodococcus wratislaviensis]|uniref:SDR family NAD(P)-dependent oxidoreductase n=1 Tax=Rhodococcus wratislaviensis TaxID=44752 RepID=UPI00364EA18E
MIVTGASSGIGRSVALELAARGYRLALAARRLDQIELVCKEVEAAGGEAFGLRCDVTSSEDVAALVRDCVGRWGRLDAAVHSAGVEVVGDVASISEVDWKLSIDVNLTGAFLLAHHAVPHLLERPSSAFVVIGSDASVNGAQGFAPYAAAKHGVIGLMRCMALDYGHRGLRSNAVCPGNTETPMLDRLLDSASSEDRQFAESALPMQRFGLSQEVAKAVAHLVGPDSGYTNGLVYNIDGGATAGYFFPDLIHHTAASAERRA